MESDKPTTPKKAIENVEACENAAGCKDGLKVCTLFIILNCFLKTLVITTQVLLQSMVNVL
jgi:hypothetical protein